MQAVQDSWKGPGTRHASTSGPGPLAFGQLSKLKLEVSESKLPVEMKTVTIWDPVAGPGKTPGPMPGDNSGLSQTWATEPRYRPPGQRGILDEELREGEAALLAHADLAP